MVHHYAKRTMRALLLTLAVCAIWPDVGAIKINIATEECFTEAVHEESTTLAGSFVAMMPREMLATQRQYDLTVRRLFDTPQSSLSHAPPDI